MEALPDEEEARLVRLILDASLPMEPLDAGPLPREFPEENAAAFMGGIRAVLFDLYGTLFISAAGDIAAGKNSAGLGETGASSAGFSASEIDLMGAYFRESAARTHEEARRAGVPWPEVDVEAIWAAYTGPVPAGFPAASGGREARELALAYELAVNPVYPMPGAETCIRSLAAGKTLGIISNAQFFSPLLFNAFFGASPGGLGFDPGLLVYSFMEREAKPSLRLFTKAAELLERRGIRAEETLYIGNDMKNDIVPAAGAGFKTALFAGDKRSLRLRAGDPLCRGAKPDMVIRDLYTLAGLPPGA